MKKHISVIVLLTVNLLCYAAPFDFSPIMHNYTSADYASGRQNWALAQGDDGVIYVGNNTCLLEYDNSVWKRYPLPSKQIVRSVHCGDDGRIYVGAYHEFGFFEKETGNYVSLCEGCRDIININDEVWNILSDSTNGNIIFQTFSSLFIYDGERVQVIRDIHPLNIFQIDGEICFQQISGDFVKLTQDGAIRTIVSQEELKTHVVAALPYDDGTLLLTDFEAGFILKDGRVSRWHTEVDSRLKSSVVNRAVVTPDGNYVIGTISGGVFSLDESGSLIWHLDMKKGLQNNTVLGMMSDRCGNIWVALDDGISYIDRTSGVSVFRPSDQMVGMVYDMITSDGITYLATNQGLYYSVDKKLNKVDGMDEQTWFVDKVDGRIYAGYNKGVYCINGTDAVRETDIGGGVFCMRSIYDKDSTWVVTGTYNKPTLYKIAKNGHWEMSPLLEDVNHMIRNMEFDGQGNIWCEHFKSGIVRMNLSQDFSVLEEQTFYGSLGEVSDSVFNVMKINGRIVFSNGRGFYTYEDINDRILPFDAMNRCLPDLKNIHQSVYVKEELYWLVGDRMAVLVESRKDCFKEIRKLPFSVLGVPIEERASMVYDSTTGCSYLLMSNLIVRIDMDAFLSPSRDRNLPVNIVGMKVKDRYGNEIMAPEGDEPRISYKYNTVSLQIRYPQYSGFDVDFRYRLSGLSEQWVVSNTDLNQTFQRLGAGKYVFTVEVEAADEILSSDSMTFHIKPPWYFSWWMSLIYVLTVMLLLRISNQLSLRSIRIENTRRLEEQKQKMREQKEAMLEEDVRQKSKDLARMSMTVIAHNEVLDSILKEIQNQKLNRSTRGLDNIRHLVQSSIISNTEQWELFQTNFDRIHENFFRKLKDGYPELTSTDLRMCAMLRLNMSTKDIANMLNLTVRGVESARYRLRKKINLPAEASLTEFMINFK